MDNSFASLIQPANSVLILLPSKPYFDQVAAGLALFLSLRDKKESQIHCPSPMTVEFNRLIGVNKISDELGNKNLVIKFVNYKAEDIERVSADVAAGELQLTVIPKSGFASPKREQVEFSFSGVSSDTVILVGGANESHFPQLVSKELDGAKIIHVGTRALSLSSQKQVFSFARPSSTVSEVVAGLIKEGGFGMDADIATNLVMGIEEGSQKFSSQEVTAATFETVADLLRSGGKRIPPRLSREEFPTGSIPGEEVGPQKKSDAPKDWLEPKIFKGTSIS